jgi:hypothetical protein
MSYRRDANAKRIQEYLRECGYEFEILDSVGRGFPDAAVIAPDGTIALVEIKNPGRMTKPPGHDWYGFTTTWTGADDYRLDWRLDQIARDVWEHGSPDEKREFRAYLFDHLDDRKGDGPEHDWHRTRRSASDPDRNNDDYNPNIFIAWSAWSVIYQMDNEV